MHDDRFAVNQLAFELTCHNAFNVTCTDVEEPAAEGNHDDEATDNVGAIPDCITDTVCVTGADPPVVNVTVPDLGFVPAFADTDNVTEPLPEPEAVDIVNQDAFDEAVHATFDIIGTYTTEGAAGGNQLVGDTDDVEAAGAIAVTV